ncbi:MAG: 3-ketoacyl-ACP reductase [Acidobacteria bacterium]|nr:3-ketoacyl-ACP reductase [Acidobacteriota bacterium]
MPDQPVAPEAPVALVTGASRGIGRAIALDLALDHRVLATYRGSEDAARSLQAETGCALFRCDIADRDDRDALLAYCWETFGRLDLLVNNAGMAPRERADLLEATEESFDEVLATNLKGPYFLTQAAARQMRDQGSGRIVFVTSISAYTSSTNRGEYCVSKAGLSMTVALFADRLAEYGVGVYEIRPGIIQTDMIAKVKGKYEKLAEEGLLPQGRLGLPEDIAKAVRAIAEGSLDYSTGQVLDVDGGFHLRRL